MTTDEISKRVFILLLELMTFLVLGSFVVSFNILHFVYLLILYSYVYRIYKSQKIVK
jgi:hypothetical protein